MNRDVHVINLALHKFSCCCLYNILITMLQNISPLEEGVFFFFFWQSKLFILWQLSLYMNVCICETQRQRKTEWVSAQSSVTSWPLHAKQHVVQCQWLKQRYARLHVCLTVPTISLKRWSVLSFYLASPHMRKLWDTVERSRGAIMLYFICKQLILPI